MIEPDNIKENGKNAKKLLSNPSTRNIEDGSMLLLKPSSTFTRQAQASMEFLLTYGWAILVVLVAISALAYFGVLDMKFLTKNSCTLPVGLSCLDHRVYVQGVTNRLEMNLKNNLGHEIKITAFDAEVFNNKHQNINPIITITHGEKTVSPNNLVILDLTNVGSGLGQKMNSGEKYSFDFTLTYTVTETGLSHTVKGSVIGKVN